MKIKKNLAPQRLIKKQPDEKSIYHICEISDEQTFLSFRDKWSATLKDATFNTIFLNHKWFSSFLKVWGDKSQLKILVAYDKTKNIVGIAPLMLTKTTFRNIPVRLLSFIENDESPHCGFIIAKDVQMGLVFSYFIDHIKYHIKGWDFCWLRKIPILTEQNLVFAAISRKKGFFSLLKPSIKSPILEIKSDWKSFYGAKNQRFKRRFRHGKNKLLKCGDVFIKEERSIWSIRKLMGEVFDLDANSWKAEVQNAIGSTKEGKRFFMNLPTSIFPEGVVSLWYLRFNKKMVAYEYHIVDGKVCYALRGSYNSNFRHLGVGSVLDSEVVPTLFDNGTKIYNMCGDTNEYKLRWTKTFMEHGDVMIFSKSFMGFLWFCAEAHVKPFVKKIISRVSKIHNSSDKMKQNEGQTDVSKDGDEI